MVSHKFLVFTIECSNRSNIIICALNFIYIYRRASLMVKMLCYGHGDTSSNPVRVILIIYSLFQIKIFNCKYYRRLNYLKQLPL